MPKCGGRICGTFPVLAHTGARGNPLENPAALPTPVSGRDRICSTGSVLSPATWPRVLPICRSVWLKCYLGVQCLLCLSFSAFFYLFLLCLIAFGVVSARCVRTDFLFSSFIWLEFNYTSGTEIPDSKYCLFAFSSIYTETQDIFPGEHFFFFPENKYIGTMCLMGRKAGSHPVVTREKR